MVILFPRYPYEQWMIEALRNVIFKKFEDKEVKPLINEYACLEEIAV